MLGSNTYGHRHLNSTDPTADVIASDSDNAPEGNWPAHAQICRNGDLWEQHTLIHQVARDPIRIVLMMLVIKHAWPELNQLTEYQSEVLITAAKALQKNDKQYADIQEQVKRNDQFSVVIGRLVRDFT